MSKRTRILLLALAGLLLIGALLLNASIQKNSRLAALARSLDAFGYAFAAEDLYVAHAGEAESIAALLVGIDLAEAAAASEAAGFPAILDRAGHVELVLAALAGGDVVTIFLLDGEIALAFVQAPVSGDVYALGGGE